MNIHFGAPCNCPPPPCQQATANYTPAGFIDNEDSTENIHPGEWRAIVENDGNALHRLKHSQGNRYKFEAAEIRNRFKKHFNSEDGSVAWQYEYARSCGKHKL